MGLYMPIHYKLIEKFHQLLAVGRWFPPGTPVSSTRKLISSSFHRLDMTLAVAEALNPNKPNYKLIMNTSRYACLYVYGTCRPTYPGMYCMHIYRPTCRPTCPGPS